MATFDYVEWERRTPITVTRMNQMSENDQYLKDRIDAMPQGILGWAKKTSNRNMANQDVGPNEYIEMANFEVEVTIEEDRLIKATYKCRNVTGGNAQGIRILGTRIIIDGNTNFGAINMQAESNSTRAFPPLIHVGPVSAGAHTFTIEHAVISGAAADGLAPNVMFEATATSPHLLVVEDIGAYVDNQ